MSDVAKGNSRGASTGRSRDAGASKDSLLQAAQTLFGRRGFESTTLREIGEKAGVDAALIARYFGSKAGLYIAAMYAEDPEGVPTDYEGLEQMANVVVTRTDRRGPGPVLQAIIRSDTSPEMRDAAIDRLDQRLLGPLVASMTARGLNRPQLRAQVVLSALLGISLARSLGWFDEIRSGPPEELVALIVDGLRQITGDGS